MKLKPHEVERFVAAPGPEIAAVLVYGPDRGLIAERAGALAVSVVEDLQDPFRVTEITMARLKEVPSLLHDEFAAMSLLGGRRLLRFRDCDNGAVAPLSAALQEATGEAALLLCEAGDLTPRDGLRKWFEAAGNAAALPCYRDDGRNLHNVIREILNQHRLRADPGALDLLAAALGEDRQLTRRELEKLALYKAGDESAVSMADVEAVIAGGGPFALSDLAIAIASGDQAGLDKGLERVFAAGQNGIAILTGVRRYFQRLHSVVADSEKGLSLDQASRKLRPPLFFKERAAFLGHARAWRRRRIESALALLTQAELDSKSAGAPVEVICRRALMRLAAAARG